MNIPTGACSQCLIVTFVFNFTITFGSWVFGSKSPYGGKCGKFRKLLIDLYILTKCSTLVFAGIFLKSRHF